VLTDRPAERFQPGAVLHVEGSAEPLTIVSATPIPDGPGWRLTFRELPDRTAAERLRGAYLEVDVDAATALRSGEYYWHEVIGATVRGMDGEELGEVADVYRVGDTEVLVVRGGPRGEFDLPVVRTFVKVFAPRSATIVVDVAALDLRSPRESREAPPRAPRRRSRRPQGGQATGAEAADVAEG
jgi:16S rRNA processing protein RimM